MSVKKIPQGRFGDDVFLSDAHAANPASLEGSINRIPPKREKCAEVFGGENIGEIVETR